MIFPVFYFGPVSYFSKLIQSKDYLLEAYEHFPKQTYRNRCYIQGANGKLRLIIPIKHDGARAIKDIRVSDEANWQKEHFKSLISAYKSSPFFEFYEDDLAPIYENRTEFLLDFNLKTMEFIQSKLKLNLSLEVTEEYLGNYNKDYRNSFNAKKESTAEFPTYMQVFSEKFDFMPDLSILDLLFNKGTAAADYLKEI